jgi:hypothetical protein
MANDIILGNSGVTQFISHTMGTYIYNDLSVSGVIRNTDLTNKLNNKSSKISMAPATISLGQPADFTYFVNENSVSYPLFSSNDITWSKTNNNIKLNISDDYKNNLNSTLASTYQPIGSYVTIGSSLLIDVDNYQVAAIT